MRFVCGDDIGAPLAMVRAHPTRSRMVGFSASRDEVFLWGWESGRLERLARLGTGRDYGPTRIRVHGREFESPRSYLPHDVAFHPDGERMATVGEGRTIEVYRVQDGQPISTIGDISEFVTETPWELPEHRGFGRIAFWDSGRSLIAHPIAGLRSRVYEFETGTTVGSLSKGFHLYAVHPREELLAMVQSDQGGTLIRFARVLETFRRDEEDKWWEEDKRDWSVPSMVNVYGMGFSPAGDAFALGGGVDGYDDWPLTVSVHDFPSLRTRFERAIGLAHEVNNQRLPVPWYTTPQCFAFGPDSRHLYVLSGSGLIIVLDAMTGEEIRRWEAHEGLATTLDVQQRTGVLVSGSLDGEAKVWTISD